MSVFVRRTLTSGPPPDLVFGELAYSDDDQVLHVGRADPAEPPTAFEGNPTDYAPAIATLTTDVEAVQIAQVAMEAIQGSQEGAIATLTTDIDALETSQAGQDAAIAGLATVATSGAYADLSGQPTIPVAGVLPNNTRINGVELFYQASKPTTRGDSSALVVGDRWWKNDDGTEWFWNGTYWLSSTLFRASLNTTTNATINLKDGVPSLLFASHISYSYILTLTNTDLQFWTVTIGIEYHNAGAVTAPVISFNTQGIALNTPLDFEVAISQLFSLNYEQAFMARAVKTGATSNVLGLGATLTYRDVFL